MLKLLLFSAFLNFCALALAAEPATPPAAPKAAAAPAAPVDEAAREVNRLWKGRGLQALEKINAVAKGDHDFIDKLPVAKQCAYVLGAAYAYVAVDSNLKVVRKDSKAKTTTYTLFFDADKASASSLSVLYRDNEHSAFALGTEGLGPGWHVSVVKGSGFDLILARENCSLGFKMSDPLDAVVLSTPKPPKPAPVAPVTAAAQPQQAQAKPQ